MFRPQSDISLAADRNLLNLKRLEQGQLPEFLPFVVCFGVCLEFYSQAFLFQLSRTSRCLDLEREG